jgi:CDP-diacylglycerol--glycerol-3-phosphate 3-phosphatidyltransferase
VPPPRNLPNLITGGRLVLAVALFGLLVAVELGRAEGGAAASRERLLLNISLVIFVLAAISDALDGQIARRWQLQTDFGRIVDPFADKVIVCGTFILLAPLKGSQVAPWMVVVILARELLVDGLRGFAEAKGVPFPASPAGKAKMVTQSVCIGWILLVLANLDGVGWAHTTTAALIGLTLAITVASGLDYVFKARAVLGADSLASLGRAAKEGAKEDSTGPRASERS